MIIVNVNNIYNAGEPGYIDKVAVNAIIAHELGTELLKPPSDMILYGKTVVWPTERQILAQDKQAIAKFNGPETKDSYSWLDPNDKYPGNSTDDGTFGLCIDPRSGSPIGYPRTPYWENIGEDRSLSVFGNATGQKGFLGSFEVETAVYCGFSMVGLDFFYSLHEAPKAVRGTVVEYRFHGRNDGALRVLRRSA